MATFKKIDDDAVGGEEPLDAYALQRIAENTESAYADRLSKYGIAFPIDNANGDNRLPILASAFSQAVYLGSKTLGVGVSEIIVTLLHQVADEPINLGVAYLRSNGLSATDPSTNVTVTGAMVVSTFTLDVSAAPRDLDLFLIFRSDFEAAASVTVPSAKIDAIVTHRVELDGTHTALSSGKRYAITWTSPSGTAPDEDFPPDKDIIYDDTSNDDWYVLPKFVRPEGGWATFADKQINAFVLGQTKVYGVHVRESDVAAREELTDRLRPGRPVVAGTMREIYRRQRELYEYRPRTLGFLYPDLEQTDGTEVVQSWGSITKYENAWNDVGSCMVGRYTESRADSGGPIEYRTMLRVRGLFVISHKVLNGQVNDLSIQWRATLASFSGGSWGGTTVTGTAITMRVAPVLANYYDELDLDHGWRYGFHRPRRLDTKPHHHYLRGTIPVSALHQRAISVHRFECFVNDSENTASRRLLRVQQQGSTTDVEGRDLTDNTVWVSMLGATVSVVEGVQED